MSKAIPDCVSRPTDIGVAGGPGYRADAGRIIREFSFRAMAPLFDDAPFVICGSPNESGNDEDRLEMWAQTPNGSLAMKASATFV